MSRGHERQFFATDGEVVTFLQEALPPEFGPYRLVGTYKVEIAKRQYEGRHFEIDVADIGSAVGAGRWSFFILPRGILPNFSLEEVTDTDRDSLCWLTGLVGLQHGRRVRGMRAASRIAVVSQVQNVRTGTIVKHDSHVAIFKALKRRIDKSLCYATIRTFPDGRELEDDRPQRMSEGAAREAQDGSYFVRVGRRLK